MLIAVAGTGFLVAAFAFHLFGLGTSCGTRPANGPNSTYFTVVMSSEGFNGSRIHSVPWPIMNVTLRQTVTIHVVNNDTTQAHGFAITHYFPSGLTMRPGECQDVTFTTDQAGTFKVYCTIFCTVHVFMQGGELNVSP